MTGDEIITLARSHFGEDSAITVSATMALGFLNTALKQLFQDLPPSRMRNRLTSDGVSLTTGQGPIPNTWDRVVEVYINNTPCQIVTREMINASDFGTSELFASPVPIAHIDDSHIWVRPESGTVQVVHLEPPPQLLAAGTSAELDAFPQVWHLSLALLIASYMYAQEEDQVQATDYLARYHRSIAGALAAQEEEAS